MIISTDGYILRVIFCRQRKQRCPRFEYLVICRDLMRKEQSISLIKMTYSLFCDSVHTITEFGFQCEMPAFLNNKTMKQRTTEETNSPRFVTKLSQVVESANSRLKRWKFLSNVVSSTQLPFIGDHVNIVASLTNAYRPPLVSDQPQEEQLAQQMIFMKSKPNHVIEKVSDIEKQRK